MNHGVHAVQHEVEHRIAHDDAGGGVSSANKKMALVIAVLALFLSFAEVMGKSSQTAALNHQIQASDMWGFYQARKIRNSSNMIAAEQARLTLPGISDPVQRAAAEKQIDAWTRQAESYRSDPSAADGQGEGFEELSGRAEAAERERDDSLARYHNFEFASAAFQIGIVLASAAVITGLILQGFVAGALAALVGLMFMAFGIIAPHILHLHLL